MPNQESIANSSNKKTIDHKDINIDLKTSILISRNSNLKRIFEKAKEVANERDKLLKENIELKIENIESEKYEKILKNENEELKMENFSLKNENKISINLLILITNSLCFLLMTFQNTYFFYKSKTHIEKLKMKKTKNLNNEKNHLGLKKLKKLAN